MNVTTWQIIIEIALVITIIDYHLWCKGGYSATISGQLYYLSRKYLFVPIIVSFLFGLACGHFFLPPPCPETLELSTTGNHTNVEPSGVEDY